jgi:signal transduction histidine kinase
LATYVRCGTALRTLTRRAGALVACALALVAAPCQAEPAKQVLLLQSLNRGHLALDHFTGLFRAGLDRRTGNPVNLVEVTVAPTGFLEDSDLALVDYINSLYEGRPPPDLIVTAGGPSAVFARKHRGRLFKSAPLLFAAVDERWFGDSTFEPNESAVPIRNDIPGLIANILQVLPETRHIFVVVGAGSMGQFWRRELDTAFERFRGRLDFSWSDKLSLEETRKRCAELPPHSAIFYVNFGTDVTGGAYADGQVVTDVHRTANAPMFSISSSYLGYGVVGGTMISVEDLSNTTADVVSHLLRGEPPARFRLPTQLASPPVWDARELQRWKIPESRLPVGSTVEFRAPGLWEEYKPLVLSATGILLTQSLLIAWLLYERRARRRAEVSSRRNLALAADANRRETLSALASSIGHELGQPLTSILHNAEALEMRLSANSATPELTAEIVADITSEANRAAKIIDRHRTMLRGRELDTRPIDLHRVVEESLALVAHDMQAREVMAECHLGAEASVVQGDPVLLQQVLVNLVRNAMDAMAETPLAPGRRRIAIRSSSTAKEVEVSVSDNGPGLAPQVSGTIFEPFVTTKPHGLGVGLAIAQRIVEAHGGRLFARTDVRAGATFIMALPRGSAGQA